MISLTIDGEPIQVADGSTLLDAARLLNIDIPTLCHLPGKDPLTTCMVCLVKVEGSPRFLPSCATKAADGMIVHSNHPDVTRARRTALELLLSDHAGDCLAPCQLVCPAHMHIDEMLRLIAENDFRRALEVVKEHIPLPATLGRICPDLCEKGCRRSHIPGDSAVSICRLHGFIGDVDLASDSPYFPPKAPATGKHIAIVGAGPAGLSAAYYLLRAGHDVTLYDAAPTPGGALRQIPHLPPATLNAEIALIEKLGVRFIPNTRLVPSLELLTFDIEHSYVTLSQLSAAFSSTLLALGPIDSAFATSLGLATATHGLAIDKHTAQTNLPNVFAAGASITPYRLAIRALADGHHAARAISAHLAGVSLHNSPHHHELFSVRLNVLTPAELQVMLADSTPTPRNHDTTLTPDRAISEAARCLHCGCAGVTDCALRQHAIAYTANPLHFKGDRRPIEPMQVSSVQCPVPSSTEDSRLDTGHSSIVFEPGKCISCGRCVAITAATGEPLGQSYTARGFDMRIKPPFDATFAEAVTKCADQVIAACPTAAIRAATP